MMKSNPLQYLTLTKLIPFDDLTCDELVNILDPDNINGPDFLGKTFCVVKAKEEKH